MNKYEILAFVIMPLFVMAAGWGFSSWTLWMLDREERKQKIR